jgi:hypothetical protein
VSNYLLALVRFEGSFFFIDDLGSRTFLFDLSDDRTAVSVSSSPSPPVAPPSSPLCWTEFEDDGVGVVEGGGGVKACACCDATMSGLILGFLSPTLKPFFYRR